MTKVDVCVVSDDVAVSDSIRDLIESTGREILTFDSLENYNRIADLAPARCLVLDVHGLDLKQTSMLEAVCAKLPVVLIADRGDLSIAVKGLQSGAADIVQKPYGKRHLIDAVERAIAS